MAMNSSNKATVKRHNISSFSNISHQIGGTLKQTANKAEKYGGLFSKDAKPEFYIGEDFQKLDLDNYKKFSEMFFSYPVGKLEDNESVRSQVGLFRKMKTMLDNLKSDSKTSESETSETDTSSLIPSETSDDKKTQIIKNLSIYLNGLALNIKGLGMNDEENSRILSNLGPRGYYDWIILHSKDLIKLLFTSGTVEYIRLENVLNTEINANLFSYDPNTGFTNKEEIAKLFNSFVKTQININLFYILFEESKGASDNKEAEAIKNFITLKENGIKVFVKDNILNNDQVKKLISFFYGTTDIQPLTPLFSQKISAKSEITLGKILATLLTLSDIKTVDKNYRTLIEKGYTVNPANISSGAWNADRLFKLLRDKGVKTITKEELAKKLTKIVAFKADVSAFLGKIGALDHVKTNNKYTAPAGEKFDEVMKKNMGSEYEKYFSAFDTDAFDSMSKDVTHGISDLFKKLKSLNIPSLTYDNVKEKVKTNSNTEIGETLVSTLMNVDDDFSPFKPSEITDLCERLSADMQKTDGDKTMCQVYSENQTNKAAYLALKKDSAEKHKQFTKTNLNLLINLQTLKSQMKKNKENTYQQYAKYGKDDLLKFMFGFVLTPSETGGPIEYSKNIGKFSDKLQIKAVKKDYITQISEPEKIDDKKTLKFKAGGIYPVFLHNIEPEFITTCARQFGITNSLGYIFYTKKSFDNDYWIYKMQNGHSYHSNKKDEFMQFVGGEDLIVVMEALQDFEITIDSSESKKKIAQLTKTLTEKGSYEQPTQLNPVPAVSTESTDSTVSANTGPGNAKSVGGGGNSKYKVTKRKKSKNQKIKMPSQKRQ